jgi:hypothetical protein
MNIHGNTPGNINNRGMTAIQGDWIYYVSREESKLYSIGLNGGDWRQLTDHDCSVSHTPEPWGIHLVGDRVYYPN